MDRVMPLPKFDFKSQVWRDTEGNEVPEKENWEYPCRVCQAPAAMSGMSPHYEYYTCLNVSCNAITKVN